MRGSASSGPGEGDQLPLAEREPEAPLAELGVVAVLELADPAVGADGAAAALDLGARRLGPRERDVLGDGAGEEEALLRHDAELAAQRLLLAPRARRGRRS